METVFCLAASVLTLAADQCRRDEGYVVKMEKLSMFRKENGFSGMYVMQETEWMRERERKREGVDEGFLSHRAETTYYERGNEAVMGLIP